jgi:hypothetical protein
MFTDEKIQIIVDKLREVDDKSSTGLVNFVDDTIDWYAIATVALECATKLLTEEKNSGC